MPEGPYLYSMKNLLLSALLLYSLAVVAQNTFNQRLNFGFPVAIFHSVLVLDSNIYVVGLVADSLPPYNSGALFVRLNQEGEANFVKTFLDSTQTFETWQGDLIVLDDGFAVNGYSIGDTSLTALLLFFGQEGEVVDFVEYENFFSADEFITSTALSKRNNHFLLATRERNPNSLNNTEIVLQYLGLEGNVVWRNSFGATPLREIPISIANLPNGAFVVGAQRTNNNIRDQNYTSRDYIFAVDSLGEMLWQYESPSWQLQSGANSIVALDDGSLVVASQQGEEVYINPSRNGVKWGNSLIYKLSPDRAIEWEVAFTDPTPSFSWNHVNKLIAANDGSGYIATGEYLDLELGVVEDVNGWIFKVSSDGDSLWSRKLRFWEEPGSSYWHFLDDMAEAPDGGFIMVGQAEHIDALAQRQQAWIIKVDEYGCLVPGCHLINTEQSQSLNQAEFLLHPNPATEYLNVFLKDNQISRRKTPQLRILSMEGKVLETYRLDPIDEVTHMIAVRQLPPGVYVLQYWTDEGILASEKFSKVE